MGLSSEWENHNHRCEGKHDRLPVMGVMVSLWRSLVGSR